MNSKAILNRIIKFKILNFLRAFSSIETIVKIKDVSDNLGESETFIFNIMIELSEDCELELKIKDKKWYCYTIQTEEDMMEKRKMYLMPIMN